MRCHRVWVAILNKALQVSAWLSVAAMAAWGQSVKEIVAVDIAAQPLGRALTSLAEQARMHILFAENLVKGHDSRSVQGRHSALSALELLLAGTELRYRIEGRATIVISESLLPGAEEARSWPATSPRSSAPLLEEVIVTAQKRQESLQEVPISMSVVTSEVLDAFSIINLEGLGSSIPNVQISHFANAPNSAVLSIRGIGVIEPDPYAGSTVSVVVDGVQQYFNQVALIDLFDIERVEVLKGPQGTLFGANTTGGVVNIVTRQPTGEFGGKARVTLGNWNRLDANVAVDFPIIENTLAGKVTVMHHGRDGWVRNVVNGQDMGSKDVTATRGYLLWTPDENFDATLSGEYVRARDGAPLVAHGAVPGETLYLAPGTNGHYQQPCRSALKPCKAPSRYRSANDSVPDRNDLDAYAATLTLNWRDTAIGDVVSITAYRQYELVNYTDQDATPNWIMDVYRDTEGWQFSQELRTTFNPTERVEVLMGGFYMQTHYEQLQSVRLQGVNPGLTQVNPQEQDNWSASLFSQAYVELTDRLQLQLGLRYTHEKTEMDASVSSFISSDGIAQWFPAGEAFRTTPGQGKKSWDNVGGKIGLDFRLSDAVMVYGYYARGFKSGGFVGRLGIPEDLGPFDPEEVDTVEVGIKGDFLEGRLRVNAALFHTDYRDMQLAQIYNLDQPDGVRVQGNTILNAASAEIRGVEVDVTLIPVDSLTLKASIAYLDAEYERFNPLNPALGTHFDMSGQPLQNAPEWTASASALYEFALWGGTAAARVEYNYTDEKYLTNLFNVPRSLIQETHLVNTNLEWTPADGRWSLSLWARNLLDERYLSSGFETTGFNAFVSYASPRETGITLNYNW